MLAAIDQFCSKTHQPTPKTAGAYVRCILESLALKYRFVLRNLEKSDGKAHRADSRYRRRIEESPAESVYSGCDGQNSVLAGPAEATALGNMAIQILATGEASRRSRKSVPSLTDPFRPRSLTSRNRQMGSANRTLRTILRDASMLEIKEDNPFERFVERGARRAVSCGKQLALLRYRSNLLGADLRITNFGGGNTSSKIELPDPIHRQDGSGSGGERQRRRSRVDYRVRFCPSLHGSSRAAQEAVSRRRSTKTRWSATTRSPLSARIELPPPSILLCMLFFRFCMSIICIPIGRSLWPPAQMGNANSKSSTENLIGRSSGFPGNVRGLNWPC